MITTYRKVGRSRRLEFHHGVEYAVELLECGKSEYDDLTFRCSDADPDTVALEPRHFAEEEARRLSVRVRRLLVSAGSASHRLTAPSLAREWLTSHLRVHGTVAANGFEVSLDVEGNDALQHAEQLVGDIDTAISARRSAMAGTNRLVAFDGLTAAAFTAALSLCAPAAAVEQLPREGELDGNGAAVVAQPIGATPPNAFRPSYRIRPVPLPHSIGSIERGSDHEAVRVVAHLRAPMVTNESLHLVLLLESGEMLQRSVRLAELRQRILYVSAVTRWYPLLAGAWGQRLIVQLD